MEDKRKVEEKAAKAFAYKQEIENARRIEQMNKKDALIKDKELAESIRIYNEEKDRQ